MANGLYRGRLAPSPTGYFHLGHARAFGIAWQRARAAHGKLVFRNEDLDYQRVRPEFLSAMYEDLRWLGLDWDEGPDVGGPFAPYSQSQRHGFYLAAWRSLRDTGLVYPCTCSRKELERSLSAPHEEPLPGAPLPGAALPGAPLPGAALSGSAEGAPLPENTLNDCGAQAPSPAVKGISAQPRVAALQSASPHDELPYPGTCREKISTAKNYDSPAGVSWRFRVPDGETLSFQDDHYGPQQFIAGRDFADFLLWRRDDIPAYQLAVVVDDEAMRITEVVRGEDLLKSTARQLLLIRALGYSVPAYFHCPLVRDENNVRLAKRHDALSLRKLREQGVKPEDLRKGFEQETSTS
jgi:glutamyl/glutaminyl-tRNA synthetase